MCFSGTWGAWHGLHLPGKEDPIFQILTKAAPRSPTCACLFLLYTTIYSWPLGGSPAGAHWIPGPQPIPPKSQSLRTVSSNLHCNKPSEWLLHMINFEDHWTKETGSYLRSQKILETSPSTNEIQGSCFFFFFAPSTCCLLTFYIEWLRLKTTESFMVEAKRIAVVWDALHLFLLCILLKLETYLEFWNDCRVACKWVECALTPRGFITIKKVFPQVRNLMREVRGKSVPLRLLFWAGLGGAGQGSLLHRCR